MDYIIESKQVLLETHNDLLMYKSILVASTETQIKYDISIRIIEKLEKILDELSNNKDDLQKSVTTLRYVLETLINVKLLIKEPDYFLKIYYYIYIHQENKVKNLISRTSKEVEVLKSCFKDYKLEIEKHEEKYMDIKFDKNIIFKKIEEKEKEKEKIFQKYNKKLQENINNHFYQLDSFGFELLISRLEEQVLKTYEDELNNFEKLKEDKAKELSKEKWFKRYMGQRLQHTEVFKKLQDRRTWKKKADIVGLSNEYQLNYEMTSSLLHFTSYSLLTSNKIKNDEKNYNNRIISQYIKLIVANINTFSGYELKKEIYQNIKIVNVL